MTRFPLTLGPRIVTSYLPLIFNRTDPKVLGTIRFFKSLKHKKEIHAKIYLAYLTKYASAVLTKKCDVIVVNSLVIGWLSNNYGRIVQNQKEAKLDNIKRQLISAGHGAGVSREIYEQYVILDKEKYIQKKSKEAKELIKQFKGANIKVKLELMDKMRFSRDKDMVNLALNAFGSESTALKNKALELLCYLSIDFKIRKEKKKEILSQIRDRPLRTLINNAFDLGEEPDNLKRIDGKLLKVGEDKSTLIYKGKEIKREPELYGDQYALNVEKRIGSALKSCINCENFEYTPLSIDMGRAFKGRCKLRYLEMETAWKSKVKPKNFNGLIKTGYEIVSIYYLCKNFEFKSYDESKRQNVIGQLNMALSRVVKK